MSLLKLVQNNTKTKLLRCNESQGLYISLRKLSIVPSIYDTENPAPKFFSSGVQILLKRLTRPNFEKVFRKRTNSNVPVLKTPVYKFLTDEELQLEKSKAYKSAERLLQMPPVVKVHDPIDDILSQDPALEGYDSSTYLFTDITYGVANEHRLVVQREPDGTLRGCDHDVRKKLNQIYFPMQGRKVKEPLMFSELEKFNSLLDRQKYEYILDRACIQYEPDEPQYQKLTSITYQHLDMNNQYDLLRSTRHFGPLVFYLAWHKSVDNLMLELIQSGIIREAVLLMALRQSVQGDLVNGEESNDLVSKILPTRIQITKPDHLCEEDIQLDTKCIECVEKYVANNSAMKSQHGLALQGFREYYQQLIEISKGLKKAHGNVKLYEGDWHKGFRHGYGALSKRLSNGTFSLEYRGEWVRGKPEGVGWWHFENGDTYFGFWKKGERHGYGKMWYNDGTFYVGYWNKSKKEGLGMFIQVNQNRYEGHWENDQKHGLGRFYHLHTGQLQEGCWSHDICIRSKMSDIIIRQFCELPTEYPIPQETLQNSQKILEQSELWLGQIIGEIDKKLLYCIDQIV